MPDRSLFQVRILYAGRMARSSLMRMHKPSLWKYVAGLLLAACIWTGCGRANTGGGFAGDAGRDWDAYRDRFINAEFQTFPDVAVHLGRHEFDGKLPDWSAG